MSLLRPAWIYAGAIIALVAAGLWLLLRPDDGPLEPPLPIVSAKSDLAKTTPIDLAISSALFADGADEETPAGQNMSGQPSQVSATPPRLVGLALKSRGASIALVLDSAGTTHLTKRGDLVDGWTLSSLGRGSAEFTKGGERKAVILGQKAEQPGTAQAPDPASTGAVQNTQKEGAQ